MTDIDVATNAYGLPRACGTSSFQCIMPSGYAMPLSPLHAAHAVPMILNPADGGIQLGNLPTLIGPTLSRDEARVAFAALVRDVRDVGTGYHGSACTGSAWVVRPLASACASTGNSSTG